MRAIETRQLIGYMMAARDALLVLNVFFLFQYQPKGDPAKRSAFGKEEGASGYGAFAAPAEAQCSWLLLTLRRFFSFSIKRTKRMGAQRKQATNGRPYVLNRSTTEFAGERFPPGLAASDTKRVEIFFDL